MPRQAVRTIIAVGAVLLLAAMPARAKDDLVIGVAQFPSSLHPDIDAEVIKAYVVNFALRPITTQDAASRSFYFKVFSKVISNPDGPLSEVVGEYAKKYIESYPKEFAVYAAGFSKTQKEVWAYQTVEYVLADVEAQRINKASEWTDKVLRGCESCNYAQLNAIKDFTAYVLRAAKDKEDTDTN